MSCQYKQHEVDTTGVFYLSAKSAVYKSHQRKKANLFLWGMQTF